MLTNNLTCKKILTALLLYMPFHYYICELLLRNFRLDNIFRDIFIIVLILLCLTTTKWKLKCKQISILVMINLILLVCFALFSFATKGYPGTFNILRTYCIPQLVFFPCSMMRFSKQDFTKIFQVLAWEMAFIALYGIFQAFVLGDTFLVKLGYESINGHLASSSFYLFDYGYNQRSVGTFVSPNQFGLILTMFLCFVMFVRFEIRHKRILMFIYVIGLLATFSRSSMIGLFFALALYFLFHIPKYFSRNKLAGYMFIGIIGTICLFYLDIVLLDNRFTKMLIRSFSSIISRTDESSAAHFRELYEPLNTIKKSPFWGLGFGNNGPLALEYDPSANVVESSIYLMMFETGVFGGIIFFLPMIYFALQGILCKFKKYAAPSMLSIIALFTFIVLPNCQNFEVLFYIYVFLGFACNSSVGPIVNNFPQDYAG